MTSTLIRPITSLVFDDITMTQLDYLVYKYGVFDRGDNRQRGRQKEKTETKRSNGDQYRQNIAFEPPGCVIMRFFASLISQPTFQSPYSVLLPVTTRQDK